MTARFLTYKDSCPILPKRLLVRWVIVTQRVGLTASVALLALVTECTVGDDPLSNDPNGRRVCRAARGFEGGRFAGGRGAERHVPAIRDAVHRTGETVERPGVLQPGTVHRRGHEEDHWAARPGAHLHVVRRAADPDHADGDAPVHRLTNAFSPRPTTWPQRCRCTLCTRVAQDNDDTARR